MASAAYAATFSSARPVTAPRITFAEAVREHQDEVYGLCLRLLGDREAALEAANTAFLKAYRAFERYDQARPLRPWLLRIATNEALNVGRSRSRHARRRAPESAAAVIADPEPSPLEASVAQEDRVRIRAAVAALPELYRSVIVLRYFDELAIEEIAAIVGRPASTIGVQLLRGRALLKSALAEASR